jgi:hypothetical protein
MAPILELDPQLNGRLRGGHEHVFLDPHEVMEATERGNGGLANADRPDIVGFDQGDVD